jgi:hypothetical protein
MRAQTLYMLLISECRILLRARGKWRKSAILFINSVDGSDEMTKISAKLIQLTQAEKFKQTARDLECDPDETRWEDKLRKVVKQKPVEKAK